MNRLEVINITAIMVSPVIAVFVGQILQNRANKRKDKMDIFNVFMAHRREIADMFTVSMSPETREKLAVSCNLIPVVFGKRFGKWFGKQTKTMEAFNVWHSAIHKNEEDQGEMTNLFTSLTNESTEKIKDFLGLLGSDVAKYWRNVSPSFEDKVVAEMAQSFRQLTMESANDFEDLINTFPHEDKVKVISFLNSLQSESMKRIAEHKDLLEKLIRAMGRQVGYRNLDVDKIEAL